MLQENLPKTVFPRLDDPTFSYNTATLNKICGTAMARLLRSLSLRCFSSRQRARASTARARPDPPLPLLLAPDDKNVNKKWKNKEGGREGGGV